LATLAAAIGAARVQREYEEPAKKGGNLASKLENWMTSLAFKSPVFQLVQKNDAVRQAMLPYIAIVSDSMRSIANPDRNPRTAVVHQQMWDGINAWQGIFAIRAETKKYTLDAVKEGRGSDAWQGTKALLKQDFVVSKYTALAIGMTAWGIVTTPIRIFAQDIPEFYKAGKERMQGKDRFWDVLFTSTNLMGDLGAIYGVAKPLGLVGLINKKLGGLAHSPASSLKAGGSTSSLTSEQAALIDSINKQLAKSFDDILPKKVKPINPANVKFRPEPLIKNLDGTYTVGTYDPVTGKVYINTNAPGVTESTIHEFLHYISDNGKIIFASGETVRKLGLEIQYLNSKNGQVIIANRLLNEGVTELFTIEVAAKMGVTKITTGYEGELNVAYALSKAIGRDTLKKAYILSDAEGLRAIVDTQLGNGAFEMINIALKYGWIDYALRIISGGMQ
jgi:hypothetical protein